MLLKFFALTDRK